MSHLRYCHTSKLRDKIAGVTSVLFYFILAVSLTPEFILLGLRTSDNSCATKVLSRKDRICHSYVS